MSGSIPRSVQMTAEAFDVTWQDGHRSVYPHRYLRGHCMCEQCVDEMSRKRRVGIEDVREDVRGEDWIDVGRYAIQILWSDGHYTGIYPFVTLRGLCPCESCEGERARQMEEK